MSYAAYYLIGFVICLPVLIISFGRNVRLTIEDIKMSILMSLGWPGVLIIMVTAGLPHIVLQVLYKVRPDLYERYSDFENTVIWRKGKGFGWKV